MLLLLPSPYILHQRNQSQPLKICDRLCHASPQNHPVAFYQICNKIQNSLMLHGAPPPFPHLMALPPGSHLPSIHLEHSPPPHVSPCLIPLPYRVSAQIPPPPGGLPGYNLPPSHLPVTYFSSFSSYSTYFTSEHSSATDTTHIVLFLGFLTH